jgi:hypothetical protein
MHQSIHLTPPNTYSRRPGWVSTVSYEAGSNNYAQTRRMYWHDQGKDEPGHVHAGGAGGEFEQWMECGHRAKHNLN